MLGPSFEEVEPALVSRLACCLDLLLIVWFSHRAACEVEGGANASGNMLWVIVFGLCVLKMIFFVVGVVMIVVF